MIICTLIIRILKHSLLSILFGGANDPPSLHSHVTAEIANADGIFDIGVIRAKVQHLCFLTFSCVQYLKE